MRYFPVFLNLRDQSCVVVGGGRVAERKVKTLLEAGARVKVISPKLTAPLARLKSGGRIVHFPRPYKAKDLEGAFLAIVATDDRAVNERVFQEATKRRMPVNVVDDPAHSSFIVPSLVKKRDLLLAISTSGRSPALARLLRRKLEKEIGPEYGRFLRLLGAARKKLISRGMGPGKNQAIFRKLVKEDLLSLIRARNFGVVNCRLAAILGPGFSLKELGLRW